MDNREDGTAGDGLGLGGNDWSNSPNPGPYWDWHSRFSFSAYSLDYPWDQWQQEQERTSPSLQFEVCISQCLAVLAVVVGVVAPPMLFNFQLFASCMELSMP